LNTPRRLESSAANGASGAEATPLRDQGAAPLCQATKLRNRATKDQA
jgi:hypothetical protein